MACRRGLAEEHLSPSERLLEHLARRLERGTWKLIALLRTAGVRPYAFIHIPKNGGLTIRRVLGDGFYRRSCMGEVGRATLYQQYLGEQRWNQAFKFCVVRNPYDRAVSIWRFLRLGYEASLHKNFGRSSGGSYGYGRDFTFHEFLEGFPEPNLWERWHMTTQSFHVTDESGGLMVDFVGRLEQFQQDFDTVCDRIGMRRVQLPHENRTGHEHYTRYYNAETRRLAEQRYGEDIERFNYQFGR
jgi:hypothetical protein